jgi:hypothetical protein
MIVYKLNLQRRWQTEQVSQKGNDAERWRKKKILTISLHFGTAVIGVLTFFITN